MTGLSPAQRAVLRTWPLRWQEDWQERAAIREYCGDQSREEAERGAFDDVTRMMRDAERSEAP
jgi:hypothetical protein